MTRRSLLLAGAGVVGAGVAFRAWQTGLVGPRPGEDLRRRWRDLPATEAIVAAGVLAASPHNSQPWRFRVAPSAIALELDERQGLGVVDPFLRQMWMGAGCALENMATAAAGLGVAHEVVTIAEGSRVALFRTAGAASGQSELLDRIARRHTNRGLYERDRPLERSLRDELALARDPTAQVELFARGDAPGVDIAAWTVEATRTLVADREFMRASDRWFRLTPRDEREHRDGPSLRCSGLPGWKRRLAVLAPRGSDEVADQSWLQMTIERHCGTAPAFGVISVGDPADRRHLVEAGRLWQRLQLQATARGLGFQPLDQLPEVADRERVVGARGQPAAGRLATLAPRGRTPVFLFRIGWPRTSAPASARRPLASFLDH